MVTTLIRCRFRGGGPLDEREILVPDAVNVYEVPRSDDSPGPDRILSEDDARPDAEEWWTYLRIGETEFELN